jgi:hypothetical protein
MGLLALRQRGRNQLPQFVCMVESTAEACR